MKTDVRVSDIPDIVPSQEHLEQRREALEQYYAAHWDEKKDGKISQWKLAERVERQLEHVFPRYGESSR